MLPHPNAIANINELTLPGTVFDPQIVKRNFDQTVKDCVELTYETVDTRIILQAMFADRRSSRGSVNERIIVKSHDTDVLVL